ncbi:unnamed protein product [Blepharisma stoltei]|uniref:Uncharacterized protein n=1 Tax=Blepharisma stoltei TaxID=1481888 RepID=A0AAU9IKB5_9CILI|nr:unnamed protein product [Blepharisma stoltei]
MGCGAPQKAFRINKSLEEEGDTSLLHYSNINLNQYKKKMITDFTQSDLTYKIHGTPYRIVVAMVKTPDRSQVFH